MGKRTIPVENEFPAANGFEDSPPEVQIAELESALKQAEAACITRLRERAVAMARADKAEAENAILRGQAPLGVQNRMNLAKEMYIFDIDGTLADPMERLHHIVGSKKDWETYDSLAHTDQPINAIITLTQVLFLAGYEIMLLTGRSERVRHTTVDWLKKYNVPYHYLVMRAQDDHREDTAVKLENLEAFRQKFPNKEVQTIFEDRKRLAEAFRKASYHVCHVAEGDF